MDNARERTGDVWTAMSHVVTILIGSGILAMAWSFAQLGWIYSPIALFVFCGVTYYSSTLLADCYRYPDPVTGVPNKEYIDAVRCYLGPRSVFWCGAIQYANIWATLLGYTITASDSMSAVWRVNCLHHGGGISCHNADSSSYIIIFFFGGVQLILSQLPSLDSISLLSHFSVATSVIYSLITLGICSAKWAMHKTSHGTRSGATAKSLLDKATNVCLAIGNIAFTYAYADVQIEIQDTLRAPPAENKTMKKASLYGLSLTTVFCMLLGVSGYAAFGNNAGGNILSGNAFHEPYWLIHVANVCVIVHFVGAYQVFAQLIFARLEGYVALWWPSAAASYDAHVLNWTVTICFMKLVGRTVVIVLTTLAAYVLPFFNPILGIIGALGFWPLAVHFPVSMHLARLKISRADSRWWALQSLSMVCLLLSILMGVASVRDIIVHKLR
uniref:Uncharacterized protein n=1 Tax=Avena sativa TaxID=4498 RepID=A0ACD5T6V6_AVESA